MPPTAMGFWEILDWGADCTFFISEWRKRDFAVSVPISEGVVLDVYMSLSV